MKACVIISAYNGEKYIIEQLKSINNQTRKIDAVFISDDGSSDNTVSLINKYIKDNELSNWILYTNRQNVGWKENFVRLIKSINVLYDVIFLCDQDDKWKKDKVELVMKQFESNERTSLIVSDLKIYYEDKSLKKLHYKSFGKSEISKVEISPRNINLRRPGCVFAVKRAFAQDCFNNYYVTGLAHDKFLWIYAFCKDSIYCLNRQLIIFRRGVFNATSLKKHGNRLTYKIEESKEMIEYMKACENVSNDAKISQIINNVIELEKNRQCFFKTKKIKYWLKCLKNIGCYANYKMWIGDLYFTLLYRKR